MPPELPAVRILIVDDDKAINDYMQTLLERDGFQVKTLNDPTFVEAAKALAHHLLARPGSDEQRLQSASQRALARPLKPQELDSLRQFLAEQRAGAGANTEFAAWTSVCRVILNLHETITVY